MKKIIYLIRNDMLNDSNRLKCAIYSTFRRA